MTDFLKQVLLKEIEQNIRKLLPKIEEMTEQTELIIDAVQKHPDSINQALIFTLNNLRYVFERLDSIEQAIEQIQNDEPAGALSPELEEQIEATLTRLQICKYIAIRLNCVDERALTETTAAPFGGPGGALLFHLTKKRLKC